MIVERMERLDLHDFGPWLLRREPYRSIAHAIAIGDRPSARIGLDRHPLGAQREQLDHVARRIGQHLHIGIAVQQQMRRQRRGQRLPARSCLDQRDGFGRPRQRRIAHRIGNQPHRALRHRIAQIQRAHLFRITLRQCPVSRPLGKARTPKLQRRTRFLAPGCLPAEPFHAVFLLIEKRRARCCAWGKPQPVTPQPSRSRSDSRPLPAREEKGVGRPASGRTPTIGQPTPQSPPFQGGAYIRACPNYCP
ncbi:hypothetical protein D9M73_105960 [compost metagenome]